MSLLRMLYLALAVWGTVHPMMHMLGWMSETGAGVTGLFAAWMANCGLLCMWPSSAFVLPFMVHDRVTCLCFALFCVCSVDVCCLCLLSLVF